MKTEEIVIQAIKNLNENHQIAELENISDQTPLFEILDSLGTLDLILELEDLLQKESGNYIAVADEFSMDKEKTPFKTLYSLKEFIKGRLDA
jgi:hypothetical protein